MRHRSQDERGCGGDQTNLGRAPEVREGREIQRTSQNKEEAPRGTKTRLRDGEELISKRDRQVCWAGLETPEKRL